MAPIVPVVILVSRDDAEARSLSILDHGLPAQPRQRLDWNASLVIPD